MKYSIIVPTFSNRVFLQQAIKAVIANTNDYELVIVDNHSEDDTLDYLRSSALDNINGQLVVNKENKGFGIACNQGAKVAKGDWLIFLNNDTLVTQDWADNMYKCKLEEADCGIVGSKLIHPGSGTIQHAGVVELSNGTLDHIYFGKQSDYKLANKRKSYFAVTGACLGISKSLFEEVGGFDERYYCGWEDIALCNIVKQKGYKIYYEPTSEVYHYESRTDGRYSAENNNFNLYIKDWVL